MFGRLRRRWIRIGAVFLMLGTVAFVFSAAFEPAWSFGNRRARESVEDEMRSLSESQFRFRFLHWTLVAAFVSFGLAGFFLAIARTRLTEEWPQKASWLLFRVAGLPLILVAIIQATVAADAAVVGDASAFERWTTFLDQAYPYFLLAFPVAVFIMVAYELREGWPLTPRWAMLATWLCCILGAVGILGGLVLGSGPVAPLALFLIGCFTWMFWAGVAMLTPEGAYKLTASRLRRVLERRMFVTRQVRTQP